MSLKSSTARRRSLRQRFDLYNFDSSNNISAKLDSTWNKENICPTAASSRLNLRNKAATRKTRQTQATQNEAPQAAVVRAVKKSKTRDSAVFAKPSPVPTSKASPKKRRPLATKDNNIRAKKENVTRKESQKPQEDAKSQKVVRRTQSGVKRLARIPTSTPNTALQTRKTKGCLQRKAKQVRTPEVSPVQKCRESTSGSPHLRVTRSSLAQMQLTPQIHSTPVPATSPEKSRCEY